MSGTELISVTGADFSASAMHEGTRVSVLLRGNADVAALDAVETLLARVHAEASRLGVAEAVVDLKAVELMNSSCFRAFITWIHDVQDLEAGRQYRIRFLSDPGRHWQRRGLHALRAFAVDLVTVEV
jgi:hypothetical protein